MADDKNLTNEITDVKNNGLEALQPAITFFKKFKAFFIGILGGILLFVLYKTFFASKPDVAKELKAETALMGATSYKEQDSFNVALNGDAQVEGYLSIIKKNKGTQAANIAMLEAAMCYLKTDKPKEALKMLENAGGFGTQVNARRLSLIGDAKSEIATEGTTVNNKGCEDAIGYYEKAANAMPDDELSAMYLAKAGNLYEKIGNTKDAIKTYQKIKSKYPDYQQIQSIDKSLGKLGVLN